MRKLCYVLLLLALQAHAETYKWKDKDGNVQYGSNPPLGTKTEPVSTIGAGNIKVERNVIRLDDVDALPYLTKNPEQGRKAYTCLLYTSRQSGCGRTTDQQRRRREHQG